MLWNPPISAVTLKPDCLDWALKHICAYHDAVFLPRPFEYDAIQHDWNNVRKWLLGQNMAAWSARPFRRFLAPKNRFAFRYVTQLDPLEYLAFTALIREIGAQLEQSRIPSEDSIVYSWRFSPSEDGRMYSKDYTWATFTSRCMHLARQSRSKWVIQADIADFFPRVSVARIEEALGESTDRSDAAYCVLQMIRKWNSKISYGLPVGLGGSRIIAEATLNYVDRHLRGAKVNFCRYSDDFRIFVESENQAKEVLEALAKGLFERDGLTLQPAKTLIEPIEDYLARFARSTERVDPESLSEEFKSILEDAEIEDDDYDTELDYDKLPEEVRERIDALNLEGILREQLSEDEPDTVIIRLILHRLGQLNKAEIVDDLLANLEKLNPLTESVLRYFKTLRGVNSMLRRHVGQRVVETLRLMPGTHSEHKKTCLLSLFTHNREYNSEDEFEHLFNEFHSPALRRELTLSLGRANKKHWFSIRRNDVANLDPWQRRAFIAAYSCIPKSESSEFFDTICQSQDVLERAISSWVAMLPFSLPRRMPSRQSALEELNEMIKASSRQVGLFGSGHMAPDADDDDDEAGEHDIETVYNSAEAHLQERKQSPEVGSSQTPSYLPQVTEPKAPMVNRDQGRSSLALFRKRAAERINGLFVKSWSALVRLGRWGHDLISRPRVPQPVDGDALLRQLSRDYTHVAGAKVFWMAIFTILPFLVALKVEALQLRFSPAGLIYILYHSLGISIWFDVRKLRFNPDGFTSEERVAEAMRLYPRHRAVKFISIMVFVLLGFTVLAKLVIYYGESDVATVKYIPQFILDFLGVKGPVD